MNGYPVAKKVRASKRDTIQLIVLTGYGREEDKRRAIESGFDAHLVKPLNPSDLCGLIADRQARSTAT